MLDQHIQKSPQKENLDVPELLENAVTASKLADGLRQRFSDEYGKTIEAVLSEYGYAADAETRKQLPLQLIKAVSALVRSDFPLIYHATERAYYMYSQTEKVFLECDRDSLVESGFAHFEKAQVKIEQDGQLPWHYLLSEKEIRKNIKEGLRPNLGETDGALERNLLVFKNMVVDLTKDYKEDTEAGGGLLSCPAPDGSVFNTQTLNASFVITEKRPEIWKQALCTMGFDSPAMMNAVEDILLYLITPSKAREELFYFYGKGSNGKSVLIKFLIEIVGRRHVAAVSLDDLQSSSFAWEGLLGKRLNLPAESGSSGFMDSEKLKAVVTDDAIAINRKNKPVISVVLPVKFVFAANRLPVFSEKTHAMYRRFRLLRFDRIVTEAERIRDFHEQLIAKRDEIVSWWLINHLLRYDRFNPAFNLPETFEAWRIEAMRGEGDPVAAFVEACVVFTGQPSDLVKSSDLCRAFKDFCKAEEMSITKWGDTIIYRKLAEDFELAKKTNPSAELAAGGSVSLTRDNRKDRYYRGIKVIAR